MSNDQSSNGGNSNSNDNGIGEVQSLPGGGGIRIQHGGGPSAVPAAPVNGNSGQGVVSGPTRIDGSGRTLSGPAVTRWNSADDQRPNTGGILATALNSMSNPTGDFSRRDISVEIEPGNAATRTHIDTAVSMGYLIKDANGSYREPTQPQLHPDLQPQHAPQAQQPQPQPQQSEAVAMAHEGLDMVARDIPSSVMAEQISRVMIAGQQADVDAISRASGMSEEKAALAVLVVQNALETLHREAAKAGGVAPEDQPRFREWSTTQAGERGKNAWLALAHGRSTAETTKLAGQWLEENPPSPASMRAAGLRTWTDNKGRELVDIPGYGVMQVSVASRLKLI